MDVAAIEAEIINIRSSETGRLNPARRRRPKDMKCRYSVE